MTAFVGRFSELRDLDRARAALDPRDSRAACVLLTGPPGVGKSRLAGEFTRRARLPSFIFAAEFDRSRPATPGRAGRRQGSSGRFAVNSHEQEEREAQLATFAAGAVASELPRSEKFHDILVPDWDTCLRLLAAAAGDEPVIVIFDNVAELAAADPSFVTALRRAWQGSFAETRVLLILVGRDLSDIPAELRTEATSIGLAPFTPAELADVLALDAVDALDAYLVSGGHPDIAAQWPTGAEAMGALEAMVSRSPSVVETRGELFLARELGLGSQAEALLLATGHGESSRAAIGRAARLPAASLDRALKQLISAGLLTSTRPLSIQPSREARYRISDPYLRFWLHMIAPRAEQIARGEMDAVVADVRRQWQRWRADSMLLVAREGMDRLARAGKLPGTGAVGGYWNRFEDIRVDLVGIDQIDGPNSVTFVGSFSWDPDAKFDHYDLAALISVRDAVPGVNARTPLVAVTLAGSAVGDAVAAVLGPHELLSAWAS